MKNVCGIIVVNRNYLYKNVDIFGLKMGDWNLCGGIGKFSF